MQNEMQEITSLQFDDIENNLQNMLDLLKNDQLFLKYVLNLNNFPLEQSFIDDNGNTILQPDIPMPYDLVGTQTVMLVLFNQNILQESKVQIFFSPLQGTSVEGDPIFYNTYTMDIIVPFHSIIINSIGKSRIFRIANRVTKLWDNKYIAGMGKVIMRSWNTYTVNKDYQGITLRFKVDESAFTDDINDVDE